MKKTAALFSLLIAGMAASAAGQALTADYVGVIKIDTDQPLPLAADASGALYVGIFGGTNGSNILKVADPVAVTEDPQDTTEWDALPRVGDVFATIPSVTWASGRGVQGLAVDSLGNVYASGDNAGGTPSDGIIAKFDSSGNPDTTFNTAAASPGFRGAGATLLNDGVIAYTLFGGLQIRNTTDFSEIAVVTGGSIYQREAVYNPTHNIFYPIKNGDNSAVTLAGVFSGGDATAGTGFTWSANTLIGDGAVDSNFGIATAHGTFDAARNLFITASQSNLEIRLFDVGADGLTFTEVLTIPAAESGPFPFVNVRDVVVIGDRLYASSTSSNGSIYVFELGEETSVQDWSLF